MVFHSYVKLPEGTEWNFWWERSLQPTGPGSYTGADRIMCFFDRSEFNQSMSIRGCWYCIIEWKLLAMLVLNDQSYRGTFVWPRTMRDSVTERMFSYFSEGRLVETGGASKSHDLPFGWWFGTCFTFPFSWEFHHPNSRTLIFFRGVGLNHQPAHL